MPSDNASKFRGIQMMRRGRSNTEGDSPRLDIMEGESLLPGRVRWVSKMQRFNPYAAGD